MTDLDARLATLRAKSEAITRCPELQQAARQAKLDEMVAAQQARLARLPHQGDR